MKTRKAIIVYPFYWDSNDVGNKRIERFKKWLLNFGYELVIISGGKNDNLTTFDWGVEIEVRDPLGIHKGKSFTSEKIAVPRKPNKWRRFIAYILFCPDLSKLWSRKVSRNKIVNEYVQNADVVISSSPPESSHLAALKIAEKAKAKFIVDMRDGWLDEPLKPLLKSSALWRWREGFIERKVLEKADCIFVTSKIWEKLLVKRYPKLLEKVTLLTNSYPENYQSGEAAKTNGELVLVHTGSFSKSSSKRKIEIVLNLILGSIEHCASSGKLLLIGKLEEFELHKAREVKNKFEKHNWSLETIAHVPKNEMFQYINEANGLVLLSVSEAAIPSKVFEYIPSRKPFLVIAPKGSAVWELCSIVPQAFFVDLENLTAAKQRVDDFLLACKTENYGCAIPEEFSFDYLSKIFLEAIH